jgi:hypothetical protein
MEAHVVAPVMPHCSLPAAQMPGMVVVQAAPALGHMMLPPRTANLHTPGCGGVRLEPAQSPLATPSDRDPGSDAKSMSGVSAESKPAWAGVREPASTAPGAQKPVDRPPLAPPTSHPHSL